MIALQGNESARPATDLALSRRFYEALGFATLLDSGVVIMGMGATSFILTHPHDLDWVRHCMMQLMVDDLDAWWGKIEALDLPARFGVSAPRPPAMQPWGLRVAYVADPAGILWHIAERRPGNRAD
jgi:hypothetical protein